MHNYMYIKTLITCKLTRIACGVPRLYWIFYPIPFRSVSVCGLLFVFFGLFVFRISVFSMVSFFFASCGVRWGCFRVLFPFLFMYCSMVSCFVFFLGCRYMHTDMTWPLSEIELVWLSADTSRFALIHSDCIPLITSADVQRHGLIYR